ncbi:MAG: HNH endonuclease [Gaiellaceae bacterium]
MNCGATEHLQVHHVVRLEDGGSEFDLNNLVTLCVGCHSEQHRGEPASTGRQALTPAACFSRKSLVNTHVEDEAPLIG